MEATLKVDCEVTVGGVDVLKVFTTAANTNIGEYVKLRPGIGKPVFVWASLPAPNPSSCDFTDAVIVVADAATNQAAIDAITVDPSDVLTWG